MIETRKQYGLLYAKGDDKYKEKYSCFKQYYEEFKTEIDNELNPKVKESKK